MAKLRSDIEPVLTQLLTASQTTGKIELDAIGHALGTLAVSTDDIDALLTQLETRGREIISPSGGGTEKHLKLVVAAARTLKTTRARRPTLSEVATQAGLTPQQALVALALLRVMQRN